MAIDGLVLSGIDLKKAQTNEWIELPRAYSKQSLHVERDEITTPNHHGVRHPRKPGKVRVEFDCSANVGGACLKITDLTNHLVGVLLRFRSEEVDFITDIKAMFYQI